MIRYFPLLAALLFAGAATAQGTPTTPTDTDPMDIEMVDVDSTEEAIRFDPDRSKKLAAEGDVLFAQDEFETALAQYTLGLAYDSTYAKNAFGKARTHASMRQYQKALDAYQLTIELGTGAEGMGNIVSAARSESKAIRDNLAVQQGAQAIADKISRATSLLQAEPVSESAAGTAYGLLEEARMADYDSSQVSFYYAKALNVMGRYTDAIPYAQMAVDQSEGTADRSAFYIQLGLAHMGLDNDAEAREAFTATQGGAWEGWGTHYLGQLDAEDNDEAGG